MEFRTTRRIDAPIERTWQVWMDAARYPQWQGGVLSVRDISGPIDRAGTTYVLDHGPKMKRTVRVVDVEAPVRHVIEQSGFGVHDLTTVTFEPEGTGTRLTVTIHMQFNRVMKVLARLDRRSRMEGEVDREIERFAKVVSRLPGPTRPGGVHVVRAGGYGRRLTVVASDDDVVHVRMHAGHLREDDLDTANLRQPKPMSDQLQLDPIPPPIRGGGLVARGLPVLLRDGGHGVQHLALSMDAWADAEGRDLGIDDPVTPEDDAAVAAWRADDGPTVGRDPELDFAPLCTIRIGDPRPARSASTSSPGASGRTRPATASSRSARPHGSWSRSRTDARCAGRRPTCARAPTAPCSRCGASSARASTGSSPPTTSPRSASPSSRS